MVGVGVEEEKWWGWRGEMVGVGRGRGEEVKNNVEGGEGKLGRERAMGEEVK